MALDITYYRQVRALDIDDDEDAYDHDGFRAYVWGGEFAGRADELVDGKAYVGDDRDDFAAGSYGGYNDWRERLAQIAGYPKDTSKDLRHQHSGGAWRATTGPFWELINFADNEGVIGAKVSTKLAADFAAFQAAVDALPDGFDNQWFKSKYADWRKAFEVASDGGCVVFH